MKMKSLLLGLLAAVASLAFTACGSHDLDPAGAYQGDTFLYQADLTITTSYSLLNGFVSWEYQNRALLAGTPQVTKAADNIRAQAKQWFASAHALRAAYAVNPTPENKANLTKILGIIQAVLLEASTYMAAPPPAPAPAQ